MDKMSDTSVYNEIAALKHRIIECKKSGKHSVELQKLCEEFTDICETVEKMADIRKHYYEDAVKKECVGLMAVQDRISMKFTESGKYLLSVCNKSTSDTCQEDIKLFGAMFEKTLTQYSRALDSAYDVSNEISSYKLTRPVKLKDLTEAVIEETTKKYHNLTTYTKNLVQVFEKFNHAFDSFNAKLKKKDRVLAEKVLTENTIKGTYWCIYQPGAAIFGVGKTEKDAWKDAEEWADDTSDKNWKQSFKSAKCSEKLYNNVNTHGTPDDWAEVNGVQITTDEDKQLKELKESIGKSEDVYTVELSGSKTNPEYVLIKNRSKEADLVDMTFSSLEKAEEYGKKKGWKVEVDKSAKKA